MSAPERGDYVTIGDSNLTWCVLDVAYYGENINGTRALLQSGQTGRKRLEPIGNLILFQKGVNA